VSEFAVLVKSETYFQRLFDRQEVVELLVDGTAIDTTNRRPRKSLTQSHDLMISNRRFFTAETRRAQRKQEQSRPFGDAG